MRISEETKAANRVRILSAAAGLFRRHGYDGIGIADLMREAGLTHGGFYNHFASKAELIAETARSGFLDNTEQYGDVDPRTAIAAYVSRPHRDDPRSGCPAAALSCEASRQPDDTRAIFAEGIEAFIALLGRGVAPTGHDGDERTRAIGLVCEAVGAVILSRACPDASPLADEIIAAAQSDCLARLGA